MLSLDGSPVAEDAGADASSEAAVVLNVSCGWPKPHKMPYEVGTLSPPRRWGKPDAE